MLVVARREKREKEAPTSSEKESRCDVAREEGGTKEESGGCSEKDTGQEAVDARETASQSLGVLPGAAGATGCAFGLCTAPSTTPLDRLYVKLQSHDRVITDHSVFDQLDLTARLDTGPVLIHDVRASDAPSRPG